jgi:hypothetical protein
MSRQVAQFPASHSLEQQSESALHESLVATHAHTPARQLPEQQSLSKTQPLVGRRHDAQTPPSQMLEQHSLSATQLAASDRHAAQTP